MNIKVEWKGKVHKLASTHQSIQDIIKDVQGRYPNHFKNGMKLVWADGKGAVVEVKNWEQMKEIAGKMGSASVKLRVVDGEIPQNYDMFASSTYSRKQSRDQTGVFEVVDLEKDGNEVHSVPKEQLKIPRTEELEAEKPKEQLTVIVSKNQPAVPPVFLKQQPKLLRPEESIKTQIKQTVIPANEEVHKDEKKEKKQVKYQGKGYVCFICKGQAGRQCEICEGKGGVEEGSPFLSFINQIVSDKLAAALANIKFRHEEKPKEEQKPVKIEQEKKPELPKTIHRYTFRITEEIENKLKFNGPTEFLWSLKIMNSGESEWPERVYLYQILGGGKYEPIADIRQVKPKQRTCVTVGFKVGRNTVQTYDMRIGFIDKYEGVVFFGPKFGFQADSLEPLPIEKLTSSEEKMKRRVEDAIKQVRHQKHPLAFILKHFDNLGFDYTTPEPLMVEVITSLQNVHY